METIVQKSIVTNQYSVKITVDSFNKRIRLDDYYGNVLQILANFENLAQKEQAQKLIIKGKRKDYPLFLEHGFQCEGVIDHYFLGEDAYIFCKYITTVRKNSQYWLEEENIIDSVKELEVDNAVKEVPNSYQLIKATKEESKLLSQLYQKVFKIYPTPLHQPTYIEKTMEEGTIYVAIKDGEKIVCAASAERNSFYKNAEVTDCATLPEHRKNGLLKLLLMELERVLKREGYYCAYSLARALSFGMNAALQQLGYRYRGRLINNCYIFDKLENMNIWVKDLSL